MARRFILHAGFHKTATTTLQHFLKENGEILSAQYSLWVSEFIKPISNKASKFSMQRDYEILTEMTERLSVYLEEEAKLHDLDVICSHEDFSGQLPGRSKSNNNYDAIFETLPALCETIKKSGLFTEIIVYFSTRDYTKWIESLYWHLIQSTNLRLELKTFKKQHRSFPDLEDIVTNIRKIMPELTIISANIDDYSTAEFGATTPFIDLIDPPMKIRENLQNIPRRRVRLPLEASLKLLKLNQDETLKNKVRQEQKFAIIEHYSKFSSG